MSETTLTDGVREDGTVEGWYVETFYAQCQGILTDRAKQYVRVICELDGYDVETRVLFETLIADGWTPPSQS
jgi:hypothetical protein